MYFFTVYKNYCIANRYYLKVSQTQLRYHLVWTDKKRIKLNLPKLDNAKFLFSKLSYFNSIEDPNFQNFITDVINSREDLKNFLLGSSVISDSIQEEINLAVLNTNSNNNNSSSSNNNNNNNNINNNNSNNNNNNNDNTIIMMMVMMRAMIIPPPVFSATTSTSPKCLLLSFKNFNQIVVIIASTISFKIW